MIIDNNPPWHCASMHDPSRRRGIWFRTLEDGTLEVRAGREGDEIRTLLKAGEVLTPLALAALVAALENGAWMQVDEGPNHSGPLGLWTGREPITAG